MSLPSQRRLPVGFTLVELLVVAAIASVVVLGLAQALGLFAHEVESVRADSDQGPEEAVALMTDMARYGWNVENPAAGKLDVFDAAGARTSFALEGNSLRVTRPSGTSGELLPGVASLSIQTDTMRRLREGDSLYAYRTWWQSPAAVAPTTLNLESGLPVALGFTMASDVPDQYDVVGGVHEQAVSASLETLYVKLVYVGAIPSDPNVPVAGTSGGHGSKVTICHVPPGNPANAHTLSVSVSALDAHLAHGDLLGACEPPPDTQTFPDVTIQLFEARAPDDARPVGQALASMTLMGIALPLGSASWVSTPIGGSGSPPAGISAAQWAATTPDGKVVMCHVPPGKPVNAHSIKVAPAAVAAHLAHGDYFGCCGAHASATSVYTLNLNAQPTEFAFDISPLGAMVMPGRAYTLVMSMAGPGAVYIGASGLVSASNSGVAQATTAFGNLQQAAMSVPFHLKGMQRITQTQKYDQVSQVALKLVMQDGQSASGSTSVTSQAGVPGDWLGAVPGQVVELGP